MHPPQGALFKRVPGVYCGPLDNLVQLGDSMGMRMRAATAMCAVAPARKRFGVSRLLAGLALLASAFAVNAQSVNFTAPGAVINAIVGDSISAQLRTLNAGGAPTGSGVLTWQLNSCSAVQFATTPPFTADASGFTTAALTAQSPGVCTLQAQWDPDFTGPTLPIAASPPLQINVSPVFTNPAELKFTAPGFFESVVVGQTIGAEVESRVMTILTGGGSLIFEIDASCPHAVLVPPVPNTALAGGFTSATVRGISPGSCQVRARWNHDNDAMTPDAVASPTLTMQVNTGPLVITSVAGPASVIPVTADPTFAVRVMRDGLPFAANLEYRITEGALNPRVFGGACNPAFTTDVNGNGRFVFSEQALTTSASNYVVVVSAYDPNNCRSGDRAAAPSGNLPPPQVQYTFRGEPVEVVFNTPPSEIRINQLATFNVLLRTTPSGIPVAGFPLNWSFTGAATPANSGITPVTNASGQASFTFTPTTLGFRSVNIGNSSINVSSSASVAVFNLILSIETAPPSVTFTDEIGAPIRVQASKEFGSPKLRDQTPSPPLGFGAIPLGNVPVTFTISTSNGLFTANNSTTFVASTASTSSPAAAPDGPVAGPGQVLSSPVRIGRTASPVQVVVSSPGFSPLTTSYAVTPSTYLLQAVSPTSVAIASDQTTQLVAQLLRGSFSTPAPLGAGETVTWSITAPANGATISSPVPTDGSSNATSTFAPQTAGIYQVVGQFDSGIAGVNPSTVSYTINVGGPTIVRTLVPFDGDMTRGSPGFSFPISVRYLENGQPASPMTPETVVWSVSSGDATVSPATSPVGSTTAIATSNVTFGSTPGPVVISAQLGSTPNVTTFFYLEIEESLSLDVVAPASRQFDLLPGDPFEIELSLRTSRQVPLAGEVIFVAGDLVDLPSELLTDADGSVTLSGSAPLEVGRYTIEFTYEGSGAVGKRKVTGAPPLTERVTINVIEGGVGTARLIPSEGSGQRGLIGRPAIPLKAFYTVNDVPIGGAAVQWTVSGGGSPATQTTVTDSAGFATFNYTFGPTPGPVVITARTGEVSAQFTLTAELAQFVVVSGSGQRGAIQTTADQPLVVSLRDPAGAALANQVIQWSITGGSAALVGGNSGGNSTQVTTDSAGRAQVGLRFGSTPGPISVQATSSLAGAPILFTAQAELPGLRIVSGNNQSGEPGRALSQDLVVTIAPTQTKALGGVAIAWEVLAGGGTIASASSVTDANGQARNQLTLGAAAGTNQVRASIAGGPSVTFSATGIITAVELSKVSGDNQTELPTNLDSAPLVVRVRRAGGGALVANTTIVWTGSNAGFAQANSTTLANQATSVTNAQGEAQIVTRVIASGPATVSARLQNSVADPLVFSLVGAIANTQALNDNEMRVAEVLDSACIALAGLSTRTAEQEDLLLRCRELQRNSGPNPDDVSEALETLDPDVALAMTGAGLEVVTTQMSNVNGYLIEARNNPGGRGQFRLAVATPDGALPLSFLPSNLLAANAAQAAEEESAEGQDLGPDFGRWGFFASGTIGRGDYRDGERTPDYDYSSGNLTAGVDYRLSDSVILGAGLGFSRNNTDLRNDGGSLDTTGFNLIGYASWYNQSQWFVDGVLTLGRNDYDLLRNLRYTIPAVGSGITTINQVASSNTKGDQLGASLAVGRDWQKGPWSINSYLRANYLSTDYDAYQERMIANLPGAGLALAVDARKLTNTSTTLGGKATYVLSRDWGILMPHGQLEWERSYEDDATQLVTRFLADPTGTTFVQFGDEIDDNFFNVGVGVSALWPGGRSAFLAYERLLGSSRLSQDTLSLGVRVEF